MRPALRQHFLSIHVAYRMNIPEDFPRDHDVSKPSGTEPKLPAWFDKITGTYVSTGPDEEVAKRFDICDDLASQLVDKCPKNRNSKYLQLSEVQILERLLAQLLGTGWGSDAEMYWVVRRVATSLGWETPKNATVLASKLVAS